MQRKRSSTRKIRFDNNVDISEYKVDPDQLAVYPRRESKRPHRMLDLDRYNNDNQEIIARKMGLCRARGVGVLLDPSEHHLIDSVILIVGPNYDVELKLLGEDEDEHSPDGVVVERLIPHIDRSMTQKDNVMCITVPVEERDRKFIMDSGSGHDLISRKKAIRMELDMHPCDPVTFHTANGTTTADFAVEIDLGTIKETAKVQVLDDTPSVFSMGKRCMNEGYTFVWPPGQTPFMIDKNGMRINMVVRDLIPYIYLGSQDCEPHRCKLASKILSVLHRENEDNDVMFIDTESGDETIASKDVLEAKTKKNKNRKKKKATPGETEEEDGEDRSHEAIFEDPVPMSDDDAISDWDLGDIAPHMIEEIMGGPVHDEGGDDIGGLDEYATDVDEDAPEDAPRERGEATMFEKERYFEGRSKDPSPYPDSSV